MDSHGGVKFRKGWMSASQKVTGKNGGSGRGSVRDSVRSVMSEVV